MLRWQKVCVLAACLALISYAYVRTDGFSPFCVMAPLSVHPSETASLEVQRILAQPFSYLGKGRQCFVFSSADEQYVLKFFNKRYIEDPWYAVFLPKERQKRMKRRQFYEQSYPLAMREFGEEICYLHLGVSKQMPTIWVADHSGRVHQMDLNEFPFVLQRKGHLLYQGWEMVYFKEGIGGLQREVNAYLTLVHQRIQKCVADADNDVEHNWGYCEGKLVHLDPGRLYYDPTLVNEARRQEEWSRATRQIAEWLSKNYAIQIYQR